MRDDIIDNIFAQCDICDEYEVRPHTVEGKYICHSCRKEFEPSYQDAVALAFHDNREFNFLEFFNMYKITQILNEYEDKK